MKKFMLWTTALFAVAGSSFIIGWNLFNDKRTAALDKEYGYEEIYLGQEKDMFVDLPPCETCIYIEASERVNDQGNVIFNVHLYKEGEINTTLQALNGRAHTQNLDRNIAGNASPSPDGEYVIMPETKGYHDETGGVFIPYEPLFRTQRSALGFHIDPSWGKSNGEDGTVGCTAFQTMEDYNTLKQFINKNSVTSLIINY